MISIDRFHTLKLNDFLSSYKDKESYEPKHWAYGKTWLGCYNYHMIEAGSISLNYGVHTDNKLVALILERSSSPIFGKRDRIMRENACQLIGCINTGNPKEAIITKIESLDGVFVERKSPNYKGGYTGVYTYHNAILCHYILKDGIIIMITIFDPSLVLQNQIEQLKRAIELMEEDIAEDSEDVDVEYFEVEIEVKNKEIKELEQLDLSNFSHALKVIYSLPKKEDIIFTNTEIDCRA